MLFCRTLCGLGSQNVCIEDLADISLQTVTASSRVSCIQWSECEEGQGRVAAINSDKKLEMSQVIGCIWSRKFYTQSQCANVNKEIRQYTGKRFSDIPAIVVLTGLEITSWVLSQHRTKIWLIMRPRPSENGYYNYNTSSITEPLGWLQTLSLVFFLFTAEAFGWQSHLEQNSSTLQEKQESGPKQDCLTRRDKIS